MGQPFASGHVLALRRFPASSLGYGYSSVWHRDPDGRWTFWSDNAPELSCARYFGCIVERVAVAPIRVTWPGARRLRVVVGAGAIDWSLDLIATPATHLMNGLAAVLPQSAWHHTSVPRALSRLGGLLLGAGRLNFIGSVPNGQRFLTQPARAWLVRDAAATVNGVPLGEAGPLPAQAFLGDLAIPQVGLFVIGRAFFDSFDAGRHSNALVRSDCSVPLAGQGSGAA